MTTEAGNGRRHLYWPVLLLLVIILTSSFGLVAMTVLVAPGADITRISAAVAEGNSIARVVTLVIVVPAIAVLAFLDKVEGSAAVAALSAIAGYVLGGTIPK